MGSDGSLVRSGGSTEEFGERLDESKTRGCSVLVSGTVPPAVERKATRDLLGDPDVPRKRILAFTGESPESTDWYLPGGIDEDGSDVRVVDRDSRSRSVPADAKTAALPTAGTRNHGLDSLERELERVVDFFDGRGSLSSAELRLGVVSLNAVLASPDVAALEEFVRTVSGTVRDVRGVGHFRLRLGGDDHRVRALLPFVDVHIELRQREAVPAEQRWHLPKSDITTAWVRL